MIVAIIQARMGSSRLPGKVMKEIRGKPVISYLIERLRYCNTIDRIVIASTISKLDDPIVQFCIENKILHYRGSEDDVLDRFYQASLVYKATHIVRLTADCPLIDPNLIDFLISSFFKTKLDHMSLGPTYPEGLDAEIFNFTSLEKSWKNAKLKTEREHVTTHIWSNPTQFKCKILRHSSDYSKYRVTIDEPADFDVVKAIIGALYKKNKVFHLEEIVQYLDSHPEVFHLNKDIIRNEGLFKSIGKEKEARKILKEYEKIRKIS